MCFWTHQREEGIPSFNTLLEIVTLYLGSNHPDSTCSSFNSFPHLIKMAAPGLLYLFNITEEQECCKHKLEATFYLHESKQLESNDPNCSPGRRPHNRTFQNRLIPRVSITWISDSVRNIVKAWYLLEYTLYVDLCPLALPRKCTSLSLDYKPFQCLKVAFCCVRSTSEYSVIQFLWYWPWVPLAPFSVFWSWQLY